MEITSKQRVEVWLDFVMMVLHVHLQNIEISNQTHSL